jgi:hypothetical protein
MSGACSTNGGRRGMHIGYLWESRPLGRQRYRWVDNVKMYLGEMG